MSSGFQPDSTGTNPIASMEHALAKVEAGHAIHHSQRQGDKKSARFKSRATTGAAATKVFSIPELIEHILLFAVAKQMPDSGHVNLTKLKFSPMPGSARESRGGVCLFNLQRVNKAFYGGIIGSSKLMRLIFLAPYSNDVLKKAAVYHDDLVPYHTPLFSILAMLESKAGRELMDWDFGSSALAQTDSASGETILTVKLHDMDLRLGTYKHAILTVKLHDMDLRLGTYKHAISRITKAWNRPEASWRKIKISNAKEPVPLTLRLETYSDRRRWAPHIGKVRVTWKFRGDDTLEYAFDLFLELFRLLNDRGDAIRDLHEPWETEMREARSKWNSWVSQLKIEGNCLGDPKFSRSYEGKSLALERSEEVDANSQQLDAVLSQWKLKVKREQEARKSVANSGN